MTELPKVAPFTHDDVQYLPAYAQEGCPENWFFSEEMQARCSPLFNHCDTHLDVEDILIKAGVVGTDDVTDSEDEEFVVNFPDLESGHRFIDRLNEFLERKWHQLAMAYDVECE